MIFFSEIGLAPPLLPMYPPLCSMTRAVVSYDSLIVAPSCEFRVGVATSLSKVAMFSFSKLLAWFSGWNFAT